MPAEHFYYVNHHGGGHRSRAREILRHLDADVLMLSSLPRPPDLDSWVPAGSTARRAWTVLPWDTGDGLDPRAPARYDDPDAGGRLHWAPLDHRGLQQRHRMVTAAIAEHSPSLLVSDVSAEIACLARLSGVRTVSVLLPGQRDDAAHRLAFDLSSGLLAPWPQPPSAPDWLQPWLSRTFFAGGIGSGSITTGSTASSGTADAPGTRTTDRPAGRRVLPAFGAEPAPHQLHAAATTTPGWQWQLDGEPVEVDRWRQRMAEADVVVAHAGLGTVADLAATRQRAVIIPSPRPFGEQVATAALLRSLAIGPIVQDVWPDSSAWTELLERACTGPAGDWSAWGADDGARRAAAWLLGQLT